MHLDTADGGSALTVRERQVLGLVAQGETDKTMARALGCGTSAIHRHLEHLRAKSGAKNSAHLVSLAVARGWLRVMLSLLLSAALASADEQSAYRTARLRLSVARSAQRGRDAWT